jgi:hypothetical protein
VGASFGTVRLSPGLNGHVGERGSSEVPQITLDSLIHRSPTKVTRATCWPGPEN